MSEAREFSELLRERFHIERLSEAQVADLYAHYALLRRWNKALNLTSIHEPALVVERHYCESLFLAAQLPVGPISVLDVGSGAGFPGFPIAVARPEATVVLAESHQRKAVFLKEATRGRPKVRVEARRAEEPGNFDWVVSRAVRWEDVLPLVSRHVALLLGSDDAKRAAESAGVHWDPPILLPWGRSRALLIGVRT